MDIHISNLPAAEHAVGAIFGDDISRGPARAAPAQLLRVMADWPVHRADDLLRVWLHLPLHRGTIGVDEMGKGETPSYLVPLHRVQIIAGGKFIGHALRTDALGLSTIAAWERACTAQLARLRTVH